MKHVLFLCVGNSGRSQLAEALARHRFGSRATFESAGARPEPVNPYTLRTLAEIGVGAEGQFAKPIHAIELATKDLVIVLANPELFPSLPDTAQKLEWPIDDPADAPMDEAAQLLAYRTARDLIRHRLAELEELL